MIGKCEVLVVAAHPDDEVLGCGATIQKLAAAGAKITVLILGEGITSRQQYRDPHTVKTDLFALKKSARRAGKFLGSENVILKDFPDNRFDSVDLLDIIKIVEEVKDEVSPDLVFTHHSGDLNIDHEITHRAVYTAFRPLPGMKPCTLYSYEVLSSTEFASMHTAKSLFVPDTFVAVDKKLVERKIGALNIYSNELQQDPYPRSEESIRCLAALRGRQVGHQFAEAFMLLRQVII